MFTTIGIIIGIISVIILFIIYKRTHDDSILILAFLIMSETLLRLLPINTRLFVPIEILFTCYLVYRSIKDKRRDLLILLSIGIITYSILLLNGYVFHNEMALLLVVYYAYLDYTTPCSNPFKC